MTRQQTIFKAAHSKEKPYFLMLRKTAQDSTLSFEARGVITYLLSKPPDWEIDEANLRNEGGIGRDKLKRIIAELVENGYMLKEQCRDDGKYSTNVYILSEEPLTEKPSTEKPSTEKPQQHIKESLQTKESTLGEPSKETRDAIFDALALHVFGVKKGTPAYQAAGGRIAKLAWWCVGRDMEVGRGSEKRTISGCDIPVNDMAITKWSVQWNGSAKPRSPEKFVEHFYPWLQKNTVKPPTPEAATTSSATARAALLGGVND